MCQIAASLTAIGAQKEGRPDWRWVGQYSPTIARKSRTNHWGLTGPSFWALIAAKDIIFSDAFPAAGFSIPPEIAFL